MITAEEASYYKKRVAVMKIDTAVKKSAEAGYSYLTIINFTDNNDEPSVLADKSAYEAMYTDGIKDMLIDLGYKVETDYDSNYIISWKED